MVKRNMLLDDLIDETTMFNVQVFGNQKKDVFSAYVLLNQVDSYGGSRKTDWLRSKSFRYSELPVCGTSSKLLSVYSWLFQPNLDQNASYVSSKSPKEQLEFSLTCCIKRKVPKSPGRSSGVNG